jgi:hypothetical protein
MLLCLALAIATYLVLLPLDYLWFSCWESVKSRWR